MTEELEARLVRIESRLDRIETKHKPLNYNGWSNYETWAVSLWMDNEVKQYLRMQAFAEKQLKLADGNKDEAIITFTDALKEETLNGVPSYLKGVYHDLLHGALCAVNFHEIATHWMQGIELTDPEPKAETAQSEKVASAGNEPDRMKAVASRSKHTLTATPEVLAILQRSAIDEEGLTLPGEQLPRDQYEAVNQFLKLAGAKWNKSKKRHLFKKGAKAKLEALLASGEIVDEQKQFQAFYTPTSIAAEMVSVAGVSEGLQVLEPSAGSGAIADAARAAGAEVYCVELNPEAAAELEAKGYKVDQSDFLSIEPRPKFDRVVMNPPFTGDQDIKHVRHAYRFLKDGGKLVAIMSPGFTFGSNKARAEFREFVGNQGRIVKEIEAGAFSESGTEVKTLIVELNKTLEVQPDQPSLFTAA